MSTEQFVCLDCLSVGELDVHGRCSTCNSNSVISREIVKSKATQELNQRLINSENARVKDTSIHGFLVKHPSGFETFVSNPNRAIAYNECADPLTKWYCSADMSIDPNALVMTAMTRNEYIDWVKRERT